MDATTLKRLIGNFDKKELIKVIENLVNASDEAEQELLDYCQTKATDQNKSLIAEKQLVQHWKKAYSIIQMSNMYGGCLDDEEEDAFDEMRIMETLLDKNNDISWEVRKVLLDELLDQIAIDNSGFTDYLVDLSEEMCYSNKEKVYLADFLRVHGNSYYKSFASSIYRELGEDQKYLASMKEHLNYGEDYLELASYYKQHGKQELALLTALEGLKKADGRLDEIYVYLFKYYKRKNDEAGINDLYQTALRRKRDLDCITKLMYEKYKEQKNFLKQKEMLLNLVQCADDQDVKKWYIRCKDELSETDFIDNEKSILDIMKKKNLSAYYDICIEKGKTEEVLVYLKEHLQFNRWYGIDNNHRYSKALASKYPQEIIELYWKEAHYYVSLGKQKNYHYAVCVLREIRQIMRKNKWTEDWNKRYQQFLDANRRKKLLIKELDKF